MRNTCGGNSKKITASFNPQAVRQRSGLDKASQARRRPNHQYSERTGSRIAVPVPVFTWLYTHTHAHKTHLCSSDILKSTHSNTTQAHGHARPVLAVAGNMFWRAIPPLTSCFACPLTRILNQNKCKTKPNRSQAYLFICFHQRSKRTKID